MVTDFYDLLKISASWEIIQCMGLVNGPQNSLSRCLGRQGPDDCHIHGIQISTAQGKKGVTIIKRMSRVNGPCQTIVSHLRHFGQLRLVEFNVSGHHAHHRMLPLKKQPQSGQALDFLLRIDQFPALGGLATSCNGPVQSGIHDVPESIDDHQGANFHARLSPNKSASQPAFHRLVEAIKLPNRGPQTGPCAAFGDRLRGGALTGQIAKSCVRVTL